MTNQDKVQEFMETFGQTVQSYPGFPERETLDLRLELIQEEVAELIAGVAKKDFENVAKELVDILYVVYGMGHSLGINLDQCFAEVHRSNMSKLEDGRVLYRPDGKVMKGKYYSPAVLEGIIGQP
ncbi:MAG: phosphoribosyl-ATP diphosphatase [Candidatus Pelagibacter sp.]|nr:phosphoribosyl-ATP diphosphatase [Candidatus Pelagibacter sp.]|tara:strand:+ start:302 stop:676 length:375 start_codon:yes stop_codon:yes gene_type:complete